jgi:hypothetical protein
VSIKVLYHVAITIANRGVLAYQGALRPSMRTKGSYTKGGVFYSVLYCSMTISNNGLIITLASVYHNAMYH